MALVRVIIAITLACLNTNQCSAPCDLQATFESATMSVAAMASASDCCSVAVLAGMTAATMVSAMGRGSASMSAMPTVTATAAVSAMASRV